jgi:hypothetical protein
MNDGQRDGTRKPLITDENVARLIDIFRFWLGVNRKAKNAMRLPWTEAYAFIASSDALVEPRPSEPKLSEKLKDRVRVVANAMMAKRKGHGESPTDPAGFVDFFGGPTTEWAGELNNREFPFEKPAKSKMRERARRARRARR